MTMKLLLVTSLLFTCFSTIIFAEDQGRLLFEKKCMSCHLLYKPKDTSKLKSPPLDVMVPQMREFIEDNKSVETHINDFVLDPTERKAICPAVDIFGLMPSLKGELTKEELAMIARWMVKHF